MSNYELLKKFPFRLLANPEHVVTLNRVAQSMVEMCWLCRETDQSLAVLSWPVCAGNVAALHSLFQLHQIVHSETFEGIVTLFWPWTQTVENYQKRILVDRSVLTERNFDHIRRCRRGDNSVVHSFLMSLNCIKDLDPDRNIRGTRGHHATLKGHPELQHPTLFEITPQAPFAPLFAKDTPIAQDGFLKRADKYIRSCSPDARLFKVETAHALMLGVPKDITGAQLLNSSAFYARKPNLLLVNLINAASNIGVNWSDLFSDFLSSVLKAFAGSPDGAPPIMALTNSANIFNMLRYRIMVDYEKQRGKGNDSFSTCTMVNLTYDIFDMVVPTCDGNGTAAFSVATISDELADIITMGRTLRDKALGIGSKNFADAIDWLSYIMRYFVNMPGGINDYNRFIEEQFDSDQIKSIKTVSPWEPLAKVKELVDSGEAGAERRAAEEYLGKCRQLIEALKETTPLKTRLQLFFEKIAGKEKTTIFIFPNSIMSAFAEWMFAGKDVDIVGGGLVRDGNIIFLDAQQDLNSCQTTLLTSEHVYLVLPNQKVIAKILARREIPRNLCLVSDVGTALAIRRHIETLRGITSLKTVQPRLKVLSEALDSALGNDIRMIDVNEEFDFTQDAFSCNLRTDGEIGHTRGHSVVINTDNEFSIPAYEGSIILKYNEENDLQPFTKATVADLLPNDRFFVLTQDLLDSISNNINIAYPATAALRDYHTRIQQQVALLPGTKLRAKAKHVQSKLINNSQGQDIPEIESLQNVLRWLDVEKLLELPRDVVNPQAPKAWRTYKALMAAIDICDAEAEWYWGTAISITRKGRIRAGLNRNRFFYKLLIDPTSVEKYFTGDKDNLRGIIDMACQNILTVREILKESGDAD